MVILKKELMKMANFMVLQPSLAIMEIGMLHEKTKKSWNRNINLISRNLKFSIISFYNFVFFFREERTWVSGKLDGTSKYYYASGSVETRIYENGILQGMAVKQTPDGECEDRWGAYVFSNNQLFLVKNTSMLQFHSNFKIFMKLQFHEIFQKNKIIEIRIFSWNRNMI